MDFQKEQTNLAQGPSGELSKEQQNLMYGAYGVPPDGVQTVAGAPITPQAAVPEVHSLNGLPESYKDNFIATQITRTHQEAEDVVSTLNQFFDRDSEFWQRRMSQVANPYKGMASKAQTIMASNLALADINALRPSAVSNMTRDGAMALAEYHAFNESDRVLENAEVALRMGAAYDLYGGDTEAAKMAAIKNYNYAKYYDALNNAQLGVDFLATPIAKSMTPNDFAVAQQIVLNASPELLDVVERSAFSRAVAATEFKSKLFQKVKTGELNPFIYNEYKAIIDTEEEKHWFGSTFATEASAGLYYQVVDAANIANATNIDSPLNQFERDIRKTYNDAYDSTNWAASAGISLYQNEFYRGYGVGAALEAWADPSVERDLMDSIVMAMAVSGKSYNEIMAENVDTINAYRTTLALTNGAGMLLGGGVVGKSLSAKLLQVMEKKRVNLLARNLTAPLVGGAVDLSAQSAVGSLAGGQQALSNYDILQQYGISQDGESAFSVWVDGVTSNFAMNFGGSLVFASPTSGLMGYNMYRGYKNGVALAQNEAIINEVQQLSTTDQAPEATKQAVDMVLKQKGYDNANLYFRPEELKELLEQNPNVELTQEQRDKLFTDLDAKIASGDFVEISTADFAVTFKGSPLEEQLRKKKRVSRGAPSQEEQDFIDQNEVIAEATKDPNTTLLYAQNSVEERKQALLVGKTTIQDSIKANLMSRITNTGVNIEVPHLDRAASNWAGVFISVAEDMGIEADKLEGYVKSIIPKFKFYEGTLDVSTGKAQDATKGEYNRANNTVYLSNRAGVDTVVHELIHAITDIVMEAADQMPDAKRIQDFRKGFLQAMGENENRKWSDITPEERAAIQERFAQFYMMHSIGEIYQASDYTGANTLDAKGNKTGRTLAPLIAFRRILARFIGKNYDIHPTRKAKTDIEKHQRVERIVAASNKSFTKDYGLSPIAAKDGEFVAQVMDSWLSSFYDAHRLINAIPISEAPYRIPYLNCFTSEENALIQEMAESGRDKISAAALAYNPHVGQFLNKSADKYTEYKRNIIENNPERKLHEEQLKQFQSQYGEANRALAIAQNNEKAVAERISIVENELKQVKQQTRTKPTPLKTYDKLNRNENKLNRRKQEQRDLLIGLENEITNIERQISKQQAKEQQELVDYKQQIDKLREAGSNLYEIEAKNSALATKFDKDSVAELKEIRAPVTKLKSKLSRNGSKLTKLLLKIEANPRARSPEMMDVRKQAKELEQIIAADTQELTRITNEYDARANEIEAESNRLHDLARKAGEEAEKAQVQLREMNAHYEELNNRTGDSEIVAALRAGIEDVRRRMGLAEDVLRDVDSQLKGKAKTRAELKAQDAAREDAIGRASELETELTELHTNLQSMKAQTKEHKENLKRVKKAVTDTERLIEQDNKTIAKQLAHAQKQQEQDLELLDKCLAEAEAELDNPDTTDSVAKQYQVALEWQDKLTGEDANDALTEAAMRKYHANFPEELNDILERLTNKTEMRDRMAENRFYLQSKGAEALELATDVAYKVGGEILKFFSQMIEGKVLKREGIDSKTIAKAARIRAADFKYNNASPQQISMRVDSETRAAIRILSEIKSGAEAPEAFAKAYEHIIAAQVYTEMAHLTPRLRTMVDKELNELARIANNTEATRERYSAESIVMVQLLLNKIGRTKNPGAWASLESIRQTSPIEYEAIREVLESSSDVSYYRNMTFSDILKFNDLCHNILAKGELELKTRKEAESARIELLAEDSFYASQDYINSSDKLKARQRYFAERANKNDKDHRGTKKWMDLWAYCKNSTMTMQAFCETVDGEPNGPIWKLLYNDLSRANSEYLVANRKVATELSNKISKKLRDITSKKAERGLPTEIEFVGEDYSKHVIHARDTGSIRKALIPLLIHLGSESNLEAAAKNFHMTPDNFVAKINELVESGVITTDLMDIVQSIWDSYAESGVLSMAALSKIKNRHMEVVPARKIKIAGKEYRGGYAPLKRERDLDQIDLNELVDAHTDNLPPSTDPSFAQSRVGSGMPLDLSFSGLLTGLDNQLRYAYIMPSINRLTTLCKDTKNELINNLEAIQPGFREKMFEPWIKAVANQQSSDYRTSEGMNVMARLVSTFNASVMALNVVNTAQQITGMLPAKTRVSAASLLAASAKPMPLRRIKEISPFMNSRLTESGKTIGQLRRDMATPNKIIRGIDWVNDHAYVLQSTFQRVIDQRVWTAAYYDAGKMGLTGNAAASHADQAVRMSQGSFNIADSTAADRNTVVKLLMPFMNYFVTMANLQATELSTRTHRQRNKAQWFMQYMYLTAMICVMPSFLSTVIAQALKGQYMGEESEEDNQALLVELGTSPLKTKLSMFNPVVGLVGNEVINGLTGQRTNSSIFNSPVATTLPGVLNAAKDVWDYTVEGEDLSRSTISSFGMAFSIIATPTRNMATRGFVINQLLNGEYDANGVVDAARAVMTGYASPVQIGDR